MDVPTKHTKFPERKTPILNRFPRMRLRAQLRGLIALPSPIRSTIRYQRNYFSN